MPKLTTQEELIESYQAHVVLATDKHGRECYAIQYGNRDHMKVIISSLTWQKREDAQKIVDHILNSNQLIEIL